MALNREQILAAEDLPLQEVEVPEWGGTVYVRGMNGAERAELEEMDVRGAKLRPAMVMLCSCLEDGSRLFTPEDMPGLEKKSATALQRVFDVALQLSSMQKGARESLKKA